MVLLRIDKNAHKQLNMKITKHPPVISSINEVYESLKNLREVNTKKQKPRKFEEEFNMCGDLFDLSSRKKILFGNLEIAECIGSSVRYFHTKIKQR